MYYFSSSFLTQPMSVVEILIHSIFEKSVLSLPKTKKKYLRKEVNYRILLLNIWYFYNERILFISTVMTYLQIFFFSSCRVVCVKQISLSSPIL